MAEPLALGRAAAARLRDALAADKHAQALRRAADE
jgi:hypothetical protein